MPNGDYYTFFNHKVFKPHAPVYRQITESAYTPYTIDDKFPTVFDVDTNTTITLNDSYCPIGISQITVIQYNDKKAVIKDRNNVTIFDGSARPEGTYTLECLLMPKTVSVQKTDGTYASYNLYWMYCGDNEKWILK